MSNLFAFLGYNDDEHRNLYSADHYIGKAAYEYITECSEHHLSGMLKITALR